MKYICKVCGYVYDPAENGNIPFEELPEKHQNIILYQTNLTKLEKLALKEVAKEADLFQEEIRV